MTANSRGKVARRWCHISILGNCAWLRSQLVRQQWLKKKIRPYVPNSDPGPPLCRIRVQDELLAVMGSNISASSASVLHQSCVTWSQQETPFTTVTLGFLRISVFTIPSPLPASAPAAFMMYPVEPQNSWWILWSNALGNSRGGRW